jgi:hypothetical protein
MKEQLTDKATAKIYQLYGKDFENVKVTSYRRKEVEKLIDSNKAKIVGYIMNGQVVKNYTNDTIFLETINKSNKDNELTFEIKQRKKNFTVVDSYVYVGDDEYAAIINNCTWVLLLTAALGIAISLLSILTAGQQTGQVSEEAIDTLVKAAKHLSDMMGTLI